MPFYEYDCTSETCHHTWEAEAKITAPKETVCPKCKQVTARRLIAGKTQTEFRGAGWFYSPGGYAGTGPRPK